MCELTSIPGFLLARSHSTGFGDACLERLCHFDDVRRLNTMIQTLFTVPIFLQKWQMRGANV